MSVLLTGGAGYIGSHTAVELIENNYDVIIADNFSNSNKAVIDRIKKITGMEVSLYDIDVTDSNLVRGIFSREDIDAVIHFAGFKSVEESVKEPAKYYRNNILSTTTLLEAMREYDVCNFVFSSSATVYGSCDDLPITEDMPTGCVNPYGRTKLINEQILSDASKADNNLSAVLLRYFNPIGAHESGLIGEDPNGIPNNLMPHIMQAAAGRQDILKIFGYDYPTEDGTAIRDYIHVVDLAKGHLAALKYAQCRKGAEVFNLGAGKGCSVLELVKTFEKVNNIRVPYSFEQRRRGDVGKCYANASKAYNILGWEAEKNLGDMCRDAWRWQSKNPDGYK